MKDAAGPSASKITGTEPPTTSFIAGPLPL
jgi:hypothetical protein